MDLQVGMGLEITITLRTVLMTLSVFDFMVLKLLFGSKADIAGHAFVDFDFYLSGCDSPAGGPPGVARIIDGPYRYRCLFIVGVF